MTSENVIPPGSTILVTGANGYIASHVADQLLQKGYRVRGTSRNASKSTWLKDMFDKKYAKDMFETAVVQNMAEPGAFDEACDGVSGVIHVASDTTLDPDPHKVVPPSVAGTTNALAAAAKYSAIKRFVLTSSSVAITFPKPNVEFEINTSQWNEEDVARAWKEPYSTWTSYAASKTLAEQEMWKFMKEKKPGFVTNAVLPNCNLGEVFNLKKQSSPTPGWVISLYKGDLESLKGVPPQWMVNVKDTARLHVAALLNPEVQNERILAYAFPFNFNDILDCLRKIYPDKKFVDNIEDEPRDLSKLDNSRGAELLKTFGREGWTPLEETVRENTMDLA